MLLLASLPAGMLWQWAGPAATFWAGAAFTALALLGLLIWISLAMSAAAEMISTPDPAEIFPAITRR